MELTYNLMRTFVAAFAFVLPFSLVRQMTVDKHGQKSLRMEEETCRPSQDFLQDMAVSIAGNMHYVVYAQIIPLDPEIKGAGSQTVTGSRMQPVISDSTRMYRIRPFMNSRATPLCWVIFMHMW